MDQAEVNVEEEGQCRTLSDHRSGFLITQWAAFKTRTCAIVHLSLVGFCLSSKDPKQCCDEILIIRTISAIELCNNKLFGLLLETTNFKISWDYVPFDGLGSGLVSCYVSTRWYKHVQWWFVDQSALVSLSSWVIVSCFTGSPLVADPLLSSFLPHSCLPLVLLAFFFFDFSWTVSQC